MNTVEQLKKEMEDTLTMSEKITAELPNQNRKGSEVVTFINLDTFVIGSMRKDHQPNGWSAIFFGGCANEAQVQQRIKSHYREAIAFEKGEL